MPTYQQLTSLRLDLVDQAVADWHQTQLDLQTLADRARSGMHDKAESANWEGVNAGVSKPFITTTAQRIGFAQEQAAGMHRVLDTLTEALRRCRAKLADLKQEAESQGLFVAADGRVMVAAQNHYGGGDFAVPRRYDHGWVQPPEDEENDEGWQPTGAEQFTQLQVQKQPLIDDFVARIEQILAEAADADAIADRAMREIAGEEDSAFRATKYDTLTAAEIQGLADAGRAEELMGQAPADLSEDELDALNDLLAANRDNEHFGVALATAMGPEGTLRFWAELLHQPYPLAENTDRTDLLYSLNDNLGQALGAATRSDDPAMDAWEEEIIALGPQRIGLGYDSGPFGYQVMSDLMESGTYGDDFLTAYGDALIDYERDMDPPGYAWNVSSYQHLPLGVFTEDPMTGYMQSLSHSPTAATEVFLQRDRLDYLLTRPDTNLPNEVDARGGHTFRYAIGDALFAATSGMDPNSPGPDIPPAEPRHNEIILANAVNTLAVEGNFSEEFRQPMAQILVNRGDMVIDTAGGTERERPMDQNELFDVVAQISSDAAAYAVLNEGMNYSLIEALSAESEHPNELLQNSGETVGFLESARRSALADDAEGRINDATWRSSWASYAIGSAVDFVPHFHGTLSGAVDIAVQGWLQNETASVEDDLLEENYELSRNRERQLEALAAHWLEIHGDWAQNSENYATFGLASDAIKNSANLGRDTSEGDSTQ